MSIDEENKSKRRKSKHSPKDKEGDIVVYKTNRSSKKRQSNKVAPMITTNEFPSTQKQTASVSKLSERDEAKVKPLVIKKKTNKNEYDQETFSRKISAMEPIDNSSIAKKETNVDLSRNNQAQNKTMDKTKITYPSNSNPEGLRENLRKEQDSPANVLDDMEEDIYKSSSIASPELNNQLKEKASPSIYNKQNKENIDFEEHDLDEEQDKDNKDRIQAQNQEQEDSMKMEDLLRTFENDHRSNPPAKLNLKNLGTIKSSNKNIKLIPNEQENSNHGVEWMSDKGK